MADEYEMLMRLWKLESYLTFRFPIGIYFDISNCQMKNAQKRILLEML